MIFSGLRHVLNSEFLDKEPVFKSIKNKKVIQKMAKWFRLLLIGLCINLAPTVSGQGVGYGKAVIKYLGSMFLMADGCPQVWSLNQNTLLRGSNLFLMQKQFLSPSVERSKVQRAFLLYKMLNFLIPLRLWRVFMP